MLCLAINGVHFLNLEEAVVQGDISPDVMACICVFYKMNHPGVIGGNQTLVLNTNPEYSPHPGFRRSACMVNPLSLARHLK